MKRHEASVMHAITQYSGDPLHDDMHISTDLMVIGFASIWYQSRSPHQNSALPYMVQSTIAPQCILGRTKPSLDNMI